MRGAEAARLRLESYEATAREIRASDRPLLHELTLSVFWPHRDSDLDLFLSLGRGYLALDEIGRPLASAMYFPIGDDFAMLGMMVTPPRLQAQGAGRWLLQRIMRDCAGRDLRLSSTRSGYWMYESAGFIPVGMVRQHQGRVCAVPAHAPVPGVTVRAARATDHDAIAALDAAAYGAARDEMLGALIAVSDGVVALHDGAIGGFALMRRFGRGHVIGPLVAESDAVAIALVAPLIERSQDRFIRVDVPPRTAQLQGDAFRRFLEAAGMAQASSVTEMRIGPERRASGGAVLYGVASHSFG